MRTIDHCRIPNLPRLAALCTAQAAAVARIAAPQRGDSPQQAADKANRIVAQLHRRAVLAHAIACHRHALAEEAGSVSCNHRLPPASRGLGQKVAQLSAPPAPGGTTPDELADLLARLSTFRTAWAEADNATAQLVKLAEQLETALSPRGACRWRGNKSITGAAQLIAAMRYWRRRGERDDDGTLPAHQAVLGIAQPCSQARRAGVLVTATLAKPGRVPKAADLPTWQPAQRGAAPDALGLWNVERVKLQRRALLRLDLGELPRHHAPDDCFVVPPRHLRNHHTTRQENLVPLCRKEGADLAATRAVRVLLRRGRPEAWRGRTLQHSGPAVVPCGPLEPWRLFGALMVYRFSARSLGDSLPIWVYAWGNSETHSADLYHANRDEPEAIVEAQIQNRLSSNARRMREQLDRSASDAQRAAARRKRIADTLRAARRAPALRPADSYAVGNCKPGTSAFIRALGITGDTAEGRTVAKAWRAAKFPELDRFAAVVCN